MRRLAKQAVWRQQRKAERRRKKFKAHQKAENKRRRKHPRNKRYRARVNKPDNLSRQVIKIPPTFSITKDIDVVLKHIYQIKKLAELRRLQLIDINMIDVRDIDDSAATILVSVCHDLKNASKRVRVQFPSDFIAKKHIEQLGFRKFFEGHIPNRDNLNETLKKGKEKILQKDTVPIIHKAMKTVYGVDSRNQALQGMLIELMTNSVNHAYIGNTSFGNTREKTWYISTRHDTKNKKVEFCFVDNGDGIINTIYVKFLRRYMATDSELIIKAFEGEFGSRTKKKNRGRGLVLIKNNQDKMTIRQLKVITNGVTLDFETGVATKLDTPFQGTFYSWILDGSCK